MKIATHNTSWILTLVASLTLGFYKAMAQSSDLALEAISLPKNFHREVYAS